MRLPTGFLGCFVWPFLIILSLDPSQISHTMGRFVSKAKGGVASHGGIVGPSALDEGDSNAWIRSLSSVFIKLALTVNMRSINNGPIITKN